MNYPNAIGKPQTQVGVFPGVAPVKAEVNTKFGSLQVAKPSAPRRLLDKLLTSLHLRGHQQVVSPPKPRSGPVLQPLILAAVKYAQHFSIIGLNHDSAPEVRRMLAEKLAGVLEQVRSGAATAELSPEMKSALETRNLDAFVAALKQAMLGAIDSSQQDSVGKVLDAHLKSIVGELIQASGPLTATAPDQQAALLQDKNGKPIVRLQALGVSKEDMAPMLKTLEKIGDTLFNNESNKADKLLSGLMDELRPILEKQPKAVQLAFAQSDGQSFIADLRDAVLGQVHGDLEKRQVAAQLDHFMDQSFQDAFQRLVTNLPGAQNVKGALPFMPDSANVAVLALAHLGHAAQKYAEISAETLVNDHVAPKSVRLEATLRELDSAMGDLLRLVREDAATLALNQAMKQALADGDMGVFVTALRSHVLDGMPAELGNAAAWAFDRAAVPASQADEQSHGPLKAVPIDQPTLAPKTTFDSHLLPAARLDALAATPKQRAQIEAALARVAQAMADGDPTAIREQLGRLVALLQPILAQQDGALKLAFTLSDGGAFIGDLAHAILSQAPASQRELVDTQLKLFMRPYLLEAFDQVVSQVLDKAIVEPELPDAEYKLFGRSYQRVDTKPKSESALSTQWEYQALDDPGRKITVTLPRETIQVQGRTYKRDAMHPLDSGNFGEVWTFTNPNDSNDRVVMKLPKPGGLTPGSAAARKVLVDDPLREALASVVTMGTGGGNTHNLKLLGVLRGPDGAALVSGFESGGSLLSKIDVLNMQSASPALARGKLGVLRDLVGALRRLHESKGLMHLDIALRNVLLDSKGRAVLADYGMSKLLPEGSSIDGAQTQMDNGNLPVRWLSPEALKGQPVTEKSEVFSLGVAFIEMAFGIGKGRAPWGIKSNQEILDLRVKDQWDASAMVAALGNLDPNAWPDPAMRTELLALITRMIDADPANRPTLAEVAASPLFEGIRDDDRLALRNVQPPPPAPGPQQGSNRAANEGYTTVVQLAQVPIQGGGGGEIHYNLEAQPEVPPPPVDVPPVDVDVVEGDHYRLGVQPDGPQPP